MPGYVAVGYHHVIRALVSVRGGGESVFVLPFGVDCVLCIFMVYFYFSVLYQVRTFYYQQYLAFDRGLA